MIVLKLTDEEAEILYDELDLRTDLMQEDLLSTNPPEGFDNEMRQIYEEDLPKLSRVLSRLSRARKEKRDAIKASKGAKKK